MILFELFFVVFIGAGKTTTFSMLTGDLSITEGTAFLDGFDIRTNLREVCKGRRRTDRHSVEWDGQELNSGFMQFLNRDLGCCWMP